MNTNKILRSHYKPEYYYSKNTTLKLQLKRSLKKKVKNIFSFNYEKE